MEELFNCADTYFNHMIDDIQKAQSTIDLEVYIFGEGIVGQRIHDALIAAAQRGVTVRVWLMVLVHLGGVAQWRAV